MKRKTFVFAMMLFVGLSVLIPAARAEESTQKKVQSYVTTLETGPVTKHEPQTYTVDCATDVVTNMTTGKQVCTNGLNGMPLLFEGDIVRFLPVQQPVDELYQGVKGYIFNADHPSGHASAKTFACKDDGKVHVEVIETAAWGDLDPKTNENLYITAIKITGDEPVRLRAGGGGDYTLKWDGKNPVYKYQVRNLEFGYIPAWCPLHVEIWYQFNQSHLMTDEEKATAAYYTEEPDTTVVWGIDAIANSQAEAENRERPVLLSIHRPYIEGYFLAGQDSWPKLETNQVSNAYGYRTGTEWHGNNLEGWLDNRLEYYPVQSQSGTGYRNYGSYKDELVVRLLYRGGRTLTLDACGGTIEGYPTRIYEAEGRQYFNQELQDGTVDAQIAAGKKCIPERKGYVFDGWYEDEEYKVPVTSVKDTVNKYSDNPYDDRDKHLCRLYARWIPESHFDISNAEVKGIIGGAYTGKARKPVPVVTADGETLTPGTDYTVSYKNNTKAGTASATIKGSGRFHGSKTLTFKITKAANPMKVKAKKVTVKYSAVKNKAQTVAASKAFSITKSQGKVTYAKAGGSAKITVDKKTGKITVKKGTKKGSYKIQVKVKAAGNSNYKSAVKKVTVNIKIK